MLNTAGVSSNERNGAGPNTCVALAITALALLEVSLKLPAATLTLIVPLPVAGVTTSVADRLLAAMLKAPLVPFVTVTSSALKPVTASLNVKVNVTGPVVVFGMLSVMMTVGGVVSGVVPPPPQADSNATVAIAQAVSLVGSLYMRVSFRVSKK